ncbi:MAG TPA: SIMPL domain-containing protein, partial [Casimicrobiaceae bacterium]|nr:SIMPL domain-containing protein [Casimicrobiaceae bacterium]
MRHWRGDVLVAMLPLIVACGAGAQTPAEAAPTPQPVITITASVSSDVTNDRMHAIMRAEVDNADAAHAASDVNARMARAIARAKAAPGVDAATAGYSSYQIS